MNTKGIKSNLLSNNPFVAVVAISNIVLALALLLFLVSCSDGESEGNYVDRNGVEHVYDRDDASFVVVEDSNWYSIYVDRETKIEYVYMKNSIKTGGLTVRLDENGDPMIYDGELI